MTTPEQFGQDSADLVAILSFGWLLVIAAAWWLERRARRRREPEILPPPIDGRDHNAESIADWRRKMVDIDRTELDNGARP